MNMELWNKVKQPPAKALKEIKAGRLKGKTDINPQWRYQIMTEQFGLCGIGWKYDIVRTWNEPGANEQIFAFAEVAVRIRANDEWSDSIPGIGGSMLVTKESSGLHSSDEGYKMAVTDALSVALKMLGVAADIYMGKWDGESYAEEPILITEQQKADIVTLAGEVDADYDKMMKHFKVADIDDMTQDQYAMAMAMLEAKRKK